MRRTKPNHQKHEWDNDGVIRQRQLGSITTIISYRRPRRVMNLCDTVCECESDISQIPQTQCNDVAQR